MKLWPIRFDVISAERQLVDAKRETGERMALVQSAIRARLTRSSTLIVVAGLGVMLGVRFARRNKPRSGTDNASERKPLVALVYSLLIRFGLQRLARAWESHRVPVAQTFTEDTKP